MMTTILLIIVLNNVVWLIALAVFAMSVFSHLEEIHRKLNERKL